MSALSDPSPCALDAASVARLHERARAARWDVTRERFAAVIARAVAKQSDPGAPLAPAAIDRVADALHLEDLALAAACADGHEVAWEFFLRTYQQELTRAAVAIAGGPHGHDLADALVADLFGLDPKGTGRRSLFEYFHGRSRLSTWLRALLSRRHIDAMRAGGRTSSLDAVERADEIFPDTTTRPPDPDRRRLAAALQQALDAALAALEPRDRMRLACYHVDDMTLAQIGRVFGEHEATVSRKLQKTRDQLKAAIDAVLTSELRLGPEERRACYEQAIQLGRFDVASLRPPAASTGPPGKIPASNRSRERDGTP